MHRAITQLGSLRSEAAPHSLQHSWSGSHWNYIDDESANMAAVSIKLTRDRARAVVVVREHERAGSALIRRHAYLTMYVPPHTHTFMHDDASPAGLASADIYFVESPPATTHTLHTPLPPADELYNLRQPKCPFYVHRWS